MTTKNLIFRLFTLAFGLTAVGTAVAEDWQKLNFPSSANLTGVCFVHEDTGFVTTDRGELGRTVDGGMTWRMSRVTKGSSLEDVSFVSGNLGFVCGRGASLFRTIDGGFTWDDMSLKDTMPWLFDVEMLTPKVIVVAGATRETNNPFGGLLLRSDNGGKDFERLDQFGIGYKEFFYRPGLPLRLLALGTISTSDDLGDDWETKQTGLEKGCRAFSLNGSTGVIVGPKGMCAYSADSGKTWRVNDLNEEEIYVAVEMIDEKVGYLGGYPEIMKKTIDGGRTWVDETPSPGITVLDFCRIGNRLYAVGSSGMMVFKKLE